ncbi:MAG: hypothetical protein WC906_00580 [Parcubacteria group bacterium]|jgi:hypothetical protein
MKIVFEKIKESPVSVFRRAGYIFQKNEGNEMSFVLPMARSGYPRFHIYCHLEDANLIANLHLDQKKNTYGDETRHHGEYDNSGPVEQEANRLRSIIK